MALKQTRMEVNFQIQTAGPTTVRSAPNVQTDSTLLPMDGVFQLVPCAETTMPRVGAHPATQDTLFSRATASLPKIPTATAETVLHKGASNATQASMWAKPPGSAHELTLSAGLSTTQLGPALHAIQDMALTLSMETVRSPSRIPTANSLTPITSVSSVEPGSMPVLQEPANQ